ncbi:hypothetical protein G6F22_020708 [Rhizopus arrhizus]|nr:hypothetical protein G6F22_020708 [Rhizopus arrhizus]
MSLFRYTRAGQAPGAPRRHSPLLWIALIALILGAVALTFAWLAGWIGNRLTAQRFTDTIEATGPAHPGFRRAPSKGICRTGVLATARAGDGAAVDRRRRSLRRRQHRARAQPGGADGQR